MTASIKPWGSGEHAKDAGRDYAERLLYVSPDLIENVIEGLCLKQSDITEHLKRSPLWTLAEDKSFVKMCTRAANERLDELSQGARRRRRTK